MRTTGRTAAFAVGGVAIGLLAPQAQAQAQDAVAQFYKDKQISFVIGYPPGGAYDLYARLVSRYMGAHIPGKPAIIPRNMPGGGGHIAAGYVAGVVAPDGTTFGTADNSMHIEQVIGEKALKFDVRKLNFIGNPIVTNNVMTVWHTSGVRTMEDAKKRDVTMGATGPSNPGSQYPRASNLMFGAKFKLVYGYPGSPDLNIAMEKGEIDGRGSNDWVGWKAAKPDWVAQHKIVVLAQIGLRREKDLPDVPLLWELATNDRDRAVLKLLSSNVLLGKPVFTSPGVPAERIAALRKAFDETMTDPAFLAEAKRERLDVDPVKGEEMQRLVADAIEKTPKDIADRLREIIEPPDAGGAKK
jgi:tripartite-type tricarboxylate transporter receptor subunit TctC